MLATNEIFLARREEKSRRAAAINEVQRRTADADFASGDNLSTSAGRHDARC
jgi:hypothetical protein